MMMEHKKSPLSIDQRGLTTFSPKRHKADLSISSKERKEKLSERIGALQQLVSQYGKGFEHGVAVFDRVHWYGIVDRWYHKFLNNRDEDQGIMVFVLLQFWPLRLQVSSYVVEVFVARSLKRILGYPFVLFVLTFGSVEYLKRQFSAILHYLISLMGFSMEVLFHINDLNLYRWMNLCTKLNCIGLVGTCYIF